VDAALAVRLCVADTDAAILQQPVGLRADDLRSMLGGLEELSAVDLLPLTVANVAENRKTCACRCGSTA
jgi:hypothetical protein